MNKLAAQLGPVAAVAGCAVWLCWPAPPPLELAASGPKLKRISPERLRPTFPEPSRRDPLRPQEVARAAVASKAPTAKRAAAAPAAPPLDLNKLAGELTLNGTVISEKFRGAIINRRLYRVGQQVPAGVAGSGEAPVVLRLRQVARDQARLAHDAGTITLKYDGVQVAVRSQEGGVSRWIEVLSGLLQPSAAAPLVRREL